MSQSQKKTAGVQFQGGKQSRKSRPKEECGRPIIKKTEQEVQYQTEQEVQYHSEQGVQYPTVMAGCTALETVVVFRWAPRSIWVSLMLLTSYQHLVRFRESRPSAQRVPVSII